jgi:hypothetical protein
MEVSMNTQEIKDIALIVFGGGGLIAAFVSIYQARAAKTKTEAEASKITAEAGGQIIQNAINLVKLAKDGKLDEGKDAKPESTPQPVYTAPSRPKASIDLVKSYLKSFGINKYLQAGDDSLVFGSALETIKVTFYMTVTSGSDLQINSYALEIKEHMLTITFLKRLLELNSENKRGQIGLQRKDATYRIWVDHNLPLIDMEPSLESFKLIVSSIAKVHSEILQVAIEQKVEYENVILKD